MLEELASDNAIDFEALASADLDFACVCQIEYWIALWIEKLNLNHTTVEFMPMVIINKVTRIICDYLKSRLLAKS